jgi:hypothetical protein
MAATETVKPAVHDAPAPPQENPPLLCMSAGDMSLRQASLTCCLSFVLGTEKRKESASTAEMRFPASLPGFDPNLVPSVAESLRHISSIAVIDQTSIKRAAEMFQSVQPVAPQISEALSGLQITTPTEASKVMATMPAFNFAKTLEGLDITGMTAGFTSVSELLAEIQLPKAFEWPLNVTLRDLPSTVTADLASQFDRTAEEAVALAEVEEVAEGVEKAVGAGLAHLTPENKRELALDIVLLIGAFSLLAAWLTSDHGKDAGDGIGLLLTCAATYIRVYWLLIGKLD